MAELEASAGAAAPAPAPERISIDAVIFDLDGTLLDYEGLSHELLKAPLEARGVEGFTWDLQASIVGSRPERWSEQILEALDVPRDVLTPEAYVADYMAELEGRYGEIEPIAGAQNLVDALLARGVPLALATSTPRASFDKKMAHHPELLYAMSAVVTGDDVSEVYSEADPAETYTLRVVDDGPLGMELQFCDEGFRVEAVVGGAALREGVAAQDVIVAIQGKSCALRDWPEAAYAPEIFFAPRPLVLTMARARKFAPSPRRPPAGDSLLDVVHSLELLDSLDAPPPPPPPKRRFARWQLASHGRWVPAAEADDDAPNSVLSDDDGGGDDDDDEPPPDARYDDDGAWSDASWSDADELGSRTP